MRWAIILLALIIPATAKAQVVTNLTDPVYLAVTTNPTSGGGVCGPPYCVNPQQGIPLDYFATSSSVAALSAKIDASIAALNPVAINTQFANVSYQLAAMNDRISIATEVATVAAAMRDAIPNPGDRFAIRLNAAAIDGYAAGSIGVGVALTDNTRLSVNYGRGRTQNVVSGGMNISFH